MKHREDARTEELTHLKLALATFAVQLDVFEMRAQSALLAFGKTDHPVPQPDNSRWSRRDWVSEG
jgi:hypothetical protein